MEHLNPTDDVIIEQPTDDVIVNSGNESGESPAPGTQGVMDEVDEKGVSYKNRYFETERKLENLTKSIPQMIQEAAQLAAQQTGVKVNQQPEYSVNDYLTAKMRDPQNAAYYDAKILELQERKIQDTVKSELTSFQRKQQEEQIRANAEAWAYQNFPQLRDPNNAFSQEVWRQFNSRSADKREPQDFAIAAELVANRMGLKPVTLANPQQEALLKKERELKKLTKERAIEGDGRGKVTNQTAVAKQQELQAALNSGDLKGYISKYLIKPVEAE